MQCDPLVIDAGCRPVTIRVTDKETSVTVGHVHKPKAYPYILWTFGPVREQHVPGPPAGEAHMVQMTDSQFVTGTVAPVDKKGNPAPIQAGSAAVTSSAESVVTVSLDPANELAVTVTAVAQGAARVTYTFDADLGDGVTTITVTEDFSITGGQAVGAGFTFGTPQEQPDAPPAQ